MSGQIHAQPLYPWVKEPKQNVYISRKNFSQKLNKKVAVGHKFMQYESKLENLMFMGPCIRFFVLLKMGDSDARNM
jgi:hypothetical protein